MYAVRRTLPAAEIIEGIDALLFAEDSHRQLGHMYASPDFLSDFRLLPPCVNVHLARSLNVRGSPLLFELRGKEARVLNEQMTLAGEDVQAFAQSIFLAWPDVERVVFPVIAALDRALPQLPCEQRRVTHDMVLDLPASARHYEDALGKSTRSAMKRSLARLQREEGSTRIEVLRPGDDDARAIVMLEQVLALNRARMALRGHISKVDEAEARAVRTAFLRCGMLVLLHGGDSLVAGSISYRYGNSSFLYLLAHDSRFNACSPGMLCAWMTVLECIRQRQQRYHFLWGQYEYKYRLLATPRQLVCASVYRSQEACRRATVWGLTTAWANLRHDWRARLQLAALGRGDGSRLDRAMQAAVPLMKKARRLVAQARRLRA